MIIRFEQFIRVIVQTRDVWELCEETSLICTIALWSTLKDLSWEEYLLGGNKVAAIILEICSWTLEKVIELISWSLLVAILFHSSLCFALLLLLLFFEQGRDASIVQTTPPPRSTSPVKPLTEEELQQFVMERKRLNRKKRASVCVFCKNNGEIEAVYISHTLKVKLHKHLQKAKVKNRMGVNAQEGA